MRDQRRIRSRGSLAGMVPRANVLTLGIAMWIVGTTSRAQQAPRVSSPAVPTAAARAAAPRPSVSAPIVLPAELSPGTAVVAPDAVAVGVAPPGIAVLTNPDVQVVRFQGPPGLVVEVLAPRTRFDR